MSRPNWSFGVDFVIKITFMADYSVSNNHLWPHGYKNMVKTSGAGLSINRLPNALLPGNPRIQMGSFGPFTEPDSGLTATRVRPIGEYKGDTQSRFGKATCMKIIVVDDEPIIRSLARRILQRAGYEVLEAEDGYQCLKFFSENRDEVAMVVLDECMDGLTGLQTLAKLREMEPGLPCILSSGQATSPDDVPSGLNTKLSLLQKPYRADALSRMAEQLLAACRS